MKKKFSLWLNIVTICLCLCAIAIGVYAATSATLTISGQIGFTAHGVVGSVTAATIEGHAVKSGVDNKDGTPSEAVSLLSNNTPVAFNDANGIKLGTKYFSDLQNADGTTTDIVIKLTISNTSNYDIIAYIDDATTTLPTNVITNNDTIPSVKIAKNGTGNLVIGLQLKKVAKYDEDGTTITGYEYNDFNTDGSLKNLDIKLGFDKYVAATYTTGKVDIGESGSSTVNHLITTMGKDADGNDIRWYAIAKKSSGATSFTKLTDVDTTSATPESGATYIFLSEYILPTQNTNVGTNGYIAFTKNTNPNYAVDFGINYNGSTVQQYLNGHGLNTFSKEYGISKCSLYADISMVDLAAESYDIYLDFSTDTGEDGTTVATKNQKLWLLSRTEYLAYFGNRNVGIGRFNGSEGDWWLRSPDRLSPDFTFANMIYYDGGHVQRGYVDHASSIGLRAAFQITIA